MAAILLVLFPLLLMVNPPLAGVALAVAIALLYGGQSKVARRAPRRSVDDNSV